MFGIGFWELAFILLLGLVVLGPEKLPRAIRTVGYYWRKMRTLAISAQQQIERELDAEEMRRYLADDKARRGEDDAKESGSAAAPAQRRPASPPESHDPAGDSRAPGDQGKP